MVAENQERLVSLLIPPLFDVPAGTATVRSYASNWTDWY